MANDLNRYAPNDSREPGLKEQAAIRFKAGVRLAPQFRSVAGYWAISNTAICKWRLNGSRWGVSCRRVISSTVVDRRPRIALGTTATALGVSRMWDGTAFSGAKIALVCGERTVAYLRDDKPEIPYPAMWDLPGGGREGDESPIDCALREVEEEFGLKLVAANVVLIQQHRSTGAGLDTYFCAMKIGPDDVASIAFGNEGQRWELMAISDFVRHDRAVPQLADRLRAAVEAGLF